MTETDLDQHAGPPDGGGSGAEGRSLRGALLWVISALVFVFTLEASIRVGDWLRWGAPLRGAYSNDALFVTDSVGWHPKPGARYQKWTINRFGFRGPEIEREPAPGVTRVVVFGSSETFGQAESRDQEFPRALERFLNARNAGRYEVINAGIPGMSVARMTEYWERWVREFRPDVAVVYPSPSFYLNVDAPADVGSVASVPPPATEGETLRLLPNLRQTLDRLLPPSLQSAVREWQTSRLVSRQPPDWVWREVPRERLDIYARHVRGLVTALKAQEVDVVLATHADAIERPLDETERMLMVGWRRYSPRALPDVILDFELAANRALVEVGYELDTPVVRVDEMIPADRSLFSDNEHFTDAGAARAAGAMVGAVVEAAGP